MAGRASVKIQTHGIGGTKVFVNGKELEGIRSIRFSEVPGKLPELLISLQATDLTISGENVKISQNATEARPEGVASQMII